MELVLSVLERIMPVNVDAGVVQVEVLWSDRCNVDASLVVWRALEAQGSSLFACGTLTYVDVVG